LEPLTGQEGCKHKLASYFSYN